MENQTMLTAACSEKCNPAYISRSDFLKKISFSLAVLFTSCTPVKILLNTHDNKYDEDEVLKNKVLKAFVMTVVPGADSDNPDMCKIFCDNYYDFHKYTGFFVSDLCNKSQRIYKTEQFYDLSFEQRTEVIQTGLNDDLTTERIYTAAIFITQVSIYCSIYDDERGCNLIDYKGSYGFMNANLSYANQQKYLAQEITLTGNYS